MHLSRSLATPAILAAGGIISFAGSSHCQVLSDELQVSGPSPFIDCTADFSDEQGDSIRFTASEVSSGV